jgi:hypothetical protein
MPRIHSALAAERDCFGVRTLEVREFGFAALAARAAGREAETGALRADFLPGVGIGRFIRRRFLELLD